MNQKGFVPIILIVILAVSIASVGYVYLNRRSSDTLPSKPERVATPMPKTQEEKTQQKVGVTNLTPEQKIVQEVANAMKGRDWSALYRLTSSSFTADKTPEEFGKDMAAQEDSVGRVANVEILSTPNIQGKDGIRFFTVKTKVTHDNNGNLTSEQYNDYYVFEKGSWKFWYSAPMP